MNAAPFSARLLTNAPLPPWHKATPEVRAVCRKAAEHCQANGVDIAQLALQFSIRHPDMATCVTGSADPGRVRQWAEWAEKPIDQRLLDEVLEILKPIHNWFYIEGRPENNDPGGEKGFTPGKTQDAKDAKSVACAPRCVRFSLNQTPPPAPAAVPAASFGDSSGGAPPTSGQRTPTSGSFQSNVRSYSGCQKSVTL